LSKSFPDFHPVGLDKFVAEEEKETNARSHEFITEIERLLQYHIVSMLKAEYGDDVSEWWVTGVPERARTPAINLADRDGYKRGGFEHYLNLIDYREIIRSSNNWRFLSNYFGMDSPNANKDQRTKWLVSVNDIRKITMHASSGQTVSLEQLDELEEIMKSLRQRLQGSIADSDSD